MPRSIAFQFGDRIRAFAMYKVDRAKLYGFKELEVLDEQDRPCELVTLADDGRTLIGLGGTGFGFLNADRQWVRRDELKPVDVEGQVIQPVPSSFAEPIQLFDTATCDELIDHDMRLVYELKTDDDVNDLREELSRGTIFRFPFSYRGGLQADAGFLLTSPEGTMFLLVGTMAEIDWIGLPQSGTAYQDETDVTAADEMLDFDMIKRT